MKLSTRQHQRRAFNFMNNIPIVSHNPGMHTQYLYFLRCLLGWQEYHTHRHRPRPYPVCDEDVHCDLVQHRSWIPSALMQLLLGSHVKCCCRRTEMENVTQGGSVVKKFNPTLVLAVKIVRTLPLFPNLEGSLIHFWYMMPYMAMPVTLFSTSTPKQLSWPWGPLQVGKWDTYNFYLYWQESTLYRSIIYPKSGHLSAPAFALAGSEGQSFSEEKRMIT